jgi:para-nitrobenzyl esterase
VQGRERDGAVLFAGIPYASPPIGELRFKAAQPAGQWDDIRPATRFGSPAPQVATGGMTSTEVDWDEDCLFLNITTPAVDASRRPVFFWIHGGGYRTGQGGIPWYDGTSFAANDIVTVSLNYRMGALGFADLSRFGPDYATSGINGILDQITALEWVRDNIANFGGDPDCITIGGESAGGFSVGTLLGSPRAQGLFQRAIPQSGAAHHTLTAADATGVSDAFLDVMNASSIDDLLGVSADEILAGQMKTDKAVPGQLSSGVSAFYPAVGNDVLPVDPLTAIRDGMGAEVAVLLGSNKDESTLFTLGDVDAAQLARQAERLGRAELVDDYRTLLPGASSRDLSVQIATDHSFRIPAIRLAEARTPHTSNTWMYLFSWESRNPRLKSTHALEIPFMFNTLDKAGVTAFIGEGELPQHVADQMHGAWVRFIRVGDPDWPRYDLDSRKNMVFDDESVVVGNPDAGRLEAWEGLR